MKTLTDFALKKGYNPLQSVGDKLVEINFLNRLEIFSYQF